MWYKENIFFIDMKFGINQSISQTITQLPCIQLETPSSRLWNFLWIKTYTTFKDGKWLAGASQIMQEYVSRLQALYFSNSLNEMILFFSSFPPQCLPLHLTLQRLLPLSSKPFVPNFTYLGQSIYGSGQLHWMTCPWPWLKVTPVALVNKNCLSAL